MPFLSKLKIRKYDLIFSEILSWIVDDWLAIRSFVTVQSVDNVLKLAYFRRKHDYCATINFRIHCCVLRAVVLSLQSWSQTVGNAVLKNQRILSARYGIPGPTLLKLSAD